MKRNGFTLVELIAVIVILGLIGIIIVPTVNNTIENQKSKTFQTSISGLLATVKSESQNNGFATKVYRFDTNKLYECDINSENCSATVSLSTDGEIKNGEGYIKVTKDGLYSLSIRNNKFCSFKTYYNDIIFSDDMSYCDFGETVANAVDDAVYYKNDGIDRTFYLNGGTLALINENRFDVDPAIEIETGYSALPQGYIQIYGVDLFSLEIESTDFCAFYDLDSNDEIIKFYENDCTIF